MFEILRLYAINPLEDQLSLWRRIVFNYVIGNTDFHIKNFSLLYKSDLSGVKLAPAYDIIGTLIYESATREMSFNLGGIRNIDEVLDGFEAAIREASRELSDIGFENAKSIGDRILYSRKRII